MENNLSILDKGAKTSKHRILNLGMQLRKVCPWHGWSQCSLTMYSKSSGLP